jgi:hypothetical protein
MARAPQRGGPTEGGDRAEARINAVAAPARTLGTALLSLQDFLEKEHGPGAFGKVLDRMSRRHAEPLAGILLPVEWYPTECLVAALDAAHKLFGPEDFHERYGMSAADYQLNHFYRFLLRFTSPGWMFDRGTRIWHTSQTSGTWQVERSERAMRGTLSAFGVINANYCRVIVGFIRRAAQITGAPEARVDHPRCRALGSPACDFVLQW